MHPHSDTPPTNDALGTTLGRFRIAREIATGGMATVYLGHRQEAGGFTQLAAIKLMHPYLASNPKLVRMFFGEARILSNLHHPNVCRLLDFGKSDDAYYLAMELLHGETWAEVLRALKRKRVPADVQHALTAYVIAQACEGLHAAHVATDHAGTALSVVHRDVAPQNLHIGYDGSVRVLDFGVACAIEDGARTESGVVQGRFAYMAPEQLRGEPSDARADVWSLGVVLWESLTGSRAFRRASESETISAVLSHALPAWPSEPSAVPEALCSIVERALCSDPAARQQSARELGAELTRFVSAEPTPIGMAELSDWMELLFATRKAEQQKLFSDAIADSQVEPITAQDEGAHGLPALEQTKSQIFALADDHSHRRLAVFVDSFAPPPEQPELVPAELPFETQWSRGRGVVVGALLLVTVASATWLAGGTERRPASANREALAARTRPEPAPVLDLELATQADAAQPGPPAVGAPAAHGPVSQAADSTKQPGEPATVAPRESAPPAKPSTVKPSTAKPSTAKPSTAKPSTAKPSTAKPSTAKPSTAKASGAKHSAVMTSVAQPSVAKPGVAKPNNAKPSVGMPSALKPSIAKPTAATPSAPKPSVAKPSIAKPTAATPSVPKPSVAKPSTSTAKPGTAKPSTAKPSTAKPSTAQVGAAKPGTKKPVVHATTASKPAASHSHHTNKATPVETKHSK